MRFFRFWSTVPILTSFSPLPFRRQTVNGSCYFNFNVSIVGCQNQSVGYSVIRTWADVTPLSPPTPTPSRDHRPRLRVRILIRCNYYACCARTTTRVALRCLVRVKLVAHGAVRPLADAVIFVGRGFSRSIKTSTSEWK